MYMHPVRRAVGSVAPARRAATLSCKTPRTRAISADNAGDSASTFSSSTTERAEPSNTPFHSCFRTSSLTSDGALRCRATKLAPFVPSRYMAWCGQCQRSRRLQEGHSMAWFWAKKTCHSALLPDRMDSPSRLCTVQKLCRIADA